MSEIIHARDLVKRYGTLTAVDGISFSVRTGECFGFLGPNGAGKTTIIRMISCTSPVTSGELTVGEMDVRRDPRRIQAALSSHLGDIAWMVVVTAIFYTVAVFSMRRRLVK